MRLGEIWNVNFSPQVGDEIQKIRPAIIISNDAMGELKLKVVIPLTDGIRTVQEWHVPIQPDNLNGLSKSSVADCFQIKSLPENRFVSKLGILSSDDSDEVKLGIMKVLNLL